MPSENGVIALRRSLADLPMYLVRQRWDQPVIKDVAGATVEALRRTGALERIRAGQEIAITAGSRGIASLPEVLRAIVRAVRERGATPFLFPAMGSHGGGTAEGQVDLLAGMGITEATIGAPIRSSMEVVEIDRASNGLPAYLDAIASRADGIIMVNRIKKHTNFDYPAESGLTKMAVIGMGKHTQAVAVHALGNRDMGENIRRVAEVILAKAPVLAGLALVENATGGLAELVGLRAEEIIAEEPALLARSKALSAKIPYHDLDILLVERMGKNLAGTGMDTYVIGRKRIIGEPEWPEAPQISSLVVLDLTEEAHGNGLGVGLADFTTWRLVRRIDWAATMANVLTSGNLERTKVPLALDSDQEALETAAFRERAVPLERLRLACIRDTLHLRYLLVSEALATEARTRDDLEVIGEAMSLAFDAEGRWISPIPREE